MSTADFRMKRAFEEMARSGYSPSPVACRAHPSKPDPNVTTYDLPAALLLKASPHLPTPPTSPLLPLPRLHPQHRSSSPAASSPPTPGHHRVRRKSSYAPFDRPAFEAVVPPTSSTSSPASKSPKSTQNFSRPILLPATSTPPGQTAARLPSLSSTVDTLQSSPAHVPAVDRSTPLGLIGDFERLAFPEPIRVKRKFPLFKPAKRLPHHIGGEGNVAWEVHAVVVDLGDISPATDYRASVGRIESPAPAALQSTKRRQSESEIRRAQPPRPERAGRSVKFQELTTIEERQRSRQASLQSADTTNLSLTSTFSVSKFDFPAPPRPSAAYQNPESARNHHSSSPTTLYLHGTSFDLINPRQSLSLGSNSIETPAEIDGLLDDYFRDSDDHTMSPYDEVTGEVTDSQSSLHTTSSKARQRTLYETPYHARRNIMGLPDDLGQDAGLLDRRAPEPATHSKSSTSGPEAVKTEHEMVDRSTTATHTLRTPAEKGQNIAGQGIFADNTEDAYSSLYTTSSMGDPFRLTIDDLGTEHDANAVGESSPGGRTSYYAGNGALYDTEEDFRIYEDDAGADAHAAAEKNAAANANARGLEQDTTVTNIVKQYDYSRRNPLASIASDRVLISEDSSIETFRRLGEGDDVFRGSKPNTVRVPKLRIGPPASTSASSAAMTTGQSSSWEAPNNWGIGSLPSASSTYDTAGKVPPPSWAWITRGQGQPPPRTNAPSKPLRQNATSYSIGGDPPTTERTYGNTDRLLELTSRDEPASPSTAHRSGGGAHSRPHRALSEHIEAGAHMQSEEANEDKENTAPAMATAMAAMTSAIPSGLTLHGPTSGAIQRSSSRYSNEADGWETVALASQEDLMDPISRTYETEGRASEESYANTSRCSSTNRLSVPPQAPTTFTPSKSLYEMFSTQQRRRSPFEGSKTPFPKWEDFAQTDAKRAKAILEGKIAEDAITGKITPSTPKLDRDQFESNMKDLEELRKKGQSRGPRSVLEKLGKITTTTPSPMKPVYIPYNSVAKASRLHSNFTARQSETAGLLQYKGPPYMSGALPASDLQDPFQSAPRTPAGSATRRSPLVEDGITPPLTARLRDGATTGSPHAVGFSPFISTPTTETVELKRLPKQKGPRAAMSGQKELQPLNLLTPAAVSRWTERQFIRTEPEWSLEPDFSSTGALAQHLPGAHGAGFTIEQLDGSVERVNLLMRPQAARNLEKSRVQEFGSRPYFLACVACPVTAMIFGFGGLDWRMRQMTRGRIAEMDPAMKQQARWLYFFLGMIVYTILGVVIAMLVVLHKTLVVSG